MNKGLRVSLVAMLVAIPVVSQAAFSVDARLFSEYQQARRVVDQEKPVLDQVRQHHADLSVEYERLLQLKLEVELLLKQLDQADQARKQAHICVKPEAEAVAQSDTPAPVVSVFQPSEPTSARAVSHRRVKWSADPMRRRAFNRKVSLPAGFFFWDEFFSRILPSGYTTHGFATQVNVAGVYVDEKNARTKSRSDWLAMASEQIQMDVVVGRKKVAVSQSVDVAKK